MRSKIYTFFQMIHNIENAWRRRKVEDATAESEWEDYEAFLHTVTEFICGGKRWSWNGCN